MKQQLLILILMLASMGFANNIINEDFNGSSTPDGWAAHTYTGGSHTSLGTERDDSFRYPNAGTNGYLRLTEESGYQQTTMIYTNKTLDTRKDFSFTADVKITGPTASWGGADGIAFFWMSKSSVNQVIANDANVNSVADIIGGTGEWQGAPHGNDPSKSVGYYPDISGYSFEFDHWMGGDERSQEYNHFIRIDDWDHSAGSVAAADRSNDDRFYVRDGWVRAHFDYDADTETFSYYLERLDNSETSDTTTFSIADLETATGETGWYETFDEAYFGIGAATGGASAEHLVDNVQVIPEPSSALLASVVVAVGLWIRRRFVD